jgi:hypothetical protein
MWLEAALTVTVDPQLCGPMHWTVQLFPLQVTAPWHEPLPEQVSVAMLPPPATVDEHEPIPLQVSVQLPTPPPH